MKANLRASDKGFSIIELMIALLLGLILAAGIIQVFLGNRQSQRIEQTVSRMQENGRIALDMITQDARSSGFSGCASSVRGGSGQTTKISSPSVYIKVKNPTVSTVASTFTAQSAQGFERSKTGTWSPALSANLSGTDVDNARNGSDVIAVYYGADIGARISGSANGSDDVIASVQPNSACFGKDDLVMVANCLSVDLIKVTNVTNCTGATVTLKHDGTGNVDGNLGGTYSSVDSSGATLSDASKPRVMRFSQVAYYVKDTGRKNPSGGAIFSLYRYSSGAAQELVEGVEFLKLEFGESLTSGNIRYVTASDASLNWDNIVAIRVGVLVQSYDQVRDGIDNNSYTIADQTVAASGSGVLHAADRSMRQAYTATIELRNHMQ